MHHKEYKKASQRHLITCRTLLKSIQKDKQDHLQLLHNIYYLSGYIVETSLSYAFFSHINYIGDIEDSFHYKNGFKTHTFQNKIDYILRHKADLSALPLVFKRNNDNRLNDLFKNWSTDFRYYYSKDVCDRGIDEDIIGKYLLVLEEFLTIILRRF